MKKFIVKNIVSLILILTVAFVFTSCAGQEPDYKDPNLDVASLHYTWQFKYYKQLNLTAKIKDFSEISIVNNEFDVVECEKLSKYLNDYSTLLKNNFSSDKGSNNASEYLVSLSEYFNDLIKLSNEKEENARIETLNSINNKIQAVKESYNRFVSGEKDDIFTNAMPDINFANDGIASALADSIMLKNETLAEDEMIITLGGNTFFGNRANSWQDGFNLQYFSSGKSEYFPLLNVSPFFRNDEITALSYEGVIDGGEARVEDGFNGFPDYAKLLKNNNVNVVSLASEHANDFFETGKNSTKDILNQNSISNFDDTTKLSVDTKLGKTTFLSYQISDDSPRVGLILSADIQNANKEGADIIIVNFHWGNLEDEKVLDYQEKYAKLAVGYGADIVMGSHPYLIQGIQIYKKKPIFYSMGNLSHGGDKEVKYTDGYLARVKVKKLAEKSYNFEDFSIIPIKITNNENSKYQPYHATGNEGKEILKKINSLSSDFDNPVELKKWN